MRHRDAKFHVCHFTRKLRQKRIHPSPEMASYSSWWDHFYRVDQTLPKPCFQCLQKTCFAVSEKRHHGRSRGFDNKSSTSHEHRLRPSNPRLACKLFPLVTHLRHQHGVRQAQTSEDVVQGLREWFQVVAMAHSMVPLLTFQVDPEMGMSSGRADVMSVWVSGGKERASADARSGSSSEKTSSSSRTGDSPTASAIAR